MKPLIHMLRYARGMGRYYVGVSISSVVVALTGIAVPFVISRATNLMVEVVEGGAVGIEQAIFLALVLLALDVTNTMVRNLGGYWGDVMATRLKQQLSTRYYHHLLSLPQSYFDGELTGTIINRLNRAITETTNFLNMFANNFFQMLLTTGITIGIVLVYSLELAVMVVIMYPLFMWLTALTSKKWQAFQNRKNHETDMASGRFAEVIAQIKVVKSYVRESFEYRHFAKRYRKTIAITRKQSRYWHSMDIVRGVVLSVIFFMIFAYIFVQTTERRFSIGDMVLLITLINNLRMPLFNMSFIVDNFQKALAGSRDFVGVMTLRPAIEDAHHAPELVVSRGAVEFRKVSFRYASAMQKPVLTDISFTLRPGEHVALVSESGGGKTTLTNLLMRLYQPDSGEIMIDDVAIDVVQQKSLRRHIATVFQEPALFSGTIRENIAYGADEPTDEQVIAAAKAANAHDFISELDKGYDTQIGERGLKLSGGQKQRIAIARAVLKDAPILILDEATSNLDSKSEHLVQQALERLMKGRTTLIIAHRLSTIATVDRIVTLKHGRVDEIGTPKQLAKSGGIYANLLKLQRTAGVGIDDELARYDIAAERKH
ncbi:ABC transporter ATP-binding protein [Candidatus Saccharibacteria bacterium oral taxon 488]|nr:ABC transporter ATP-binding protein [Candidatus Saccharibacteria bacterium oral taxon 488]